MNFAFSEEQEELRATARRFLDQKAPSAVVRRLMESDEGFDRALWDENAAMGWQAMAIPERYGGAGFGFIELVVLLQEMGRALYPVPLLLVGDSGGTHLLESGDEEHKEKLLPGSHRVSTVWRWQSPSRRGAGTTRESNSRPCPIRGIGCSRGPSHS